MTTETTIDLDALEYAGVAWCDDHQFATLIAIARAARACGPWPRIEEDRPMRDHPTKQDDIDHDRYLNALRLLRGIESRLEVWMEDDVRTARWLMRRIESIDRDAQKRDLE